MSDTNKTELTRCEIMFSDTSVPDCDDNVKNLCDWVNINCLKYERVCTINTTNSLINTMSNSSRTAKDLHPDSDLKASIDWNPHKMIPAIFYETGRGLKSSSSIQKDDVIVKIPRHLMITCKDVITCRDIKEFLLSSRKKFSSVEILAAFLLFHKYSRNSFWLPYIKSLPTELLLPCADEISYHPSFIQQMLIKQQSLISDAFIKLESLLLNTSGKKLVREEVEWAYLTVNSRTVFLDENFHSSLLLGTDAGNCALAPFLDLLNHSHEASMTASLDTNDNCYKIVTHSAYAEGQQVFINYGAHDNAFLFVEYGFVLADNPYDGYPISLDLVIDSIRKCFEKQNLSNLDNKRKVLQTMAETENMFLTREGPTWALEAVVSVLVNVDDIANIKYFIYNDHPKSDDTSEVLSIIFKTVNQVLRIKHEQMLQKNNPSEHLKMGMLLVEQMLSVVSCCSNAFHQNSNVDL